MEGFSGEELQGASGVGFESRRRTGQGMTAEPWRRRHSLPELPAVTLLCQWPVSPNHLTKSFSINTKPRVNTVAQKSCHVDRLELEYYIVKPT